MIKSNYERVCRGTEKRQDKAGSQYREARQALSLYLAIQGRQKPFYSRQSRSRSIYRGQARQGPHKARARRYYKRNSCL